MYIGRWFDFVTRRRLFLHFSRLIRGIDLVIEPGMTPGIVRRTGSGKTTIVKLLLGTYDLPAGTIQVGGMDIRQLTLGSLRKQIAYVPQDGFLFSTTIRENIAFRPQILILDEATANLDSQTELLIQQALQVVSEGRTTLVIAHRLSTIVQADRILVMRHGTIVEEGTHAELLSVRGYYEELYRHSQGQKIFKIG